MTISAILFVNQKGDVLINRFYKDNVSRSTCDAFRMKVLAAKETGTPVTMLGQASFMYIRHGDIFLVAVTKQNSNVSLVFQFLYDLVEVFKAYFGGKFNEESIQNNFVLIYELLDETMDHGYPQIVAPNVLAEFIKVGKLKVDPRKLNSTDNPTITSEITGAIDWRQPNKHRYKKNEVFIDVLESVNYLRSTQGTALRADVAGKIVMKTFLTGMPECKFGLNDKMVMEQEGHQGVRRRQGKGIAIDDITFHRCVRLGKFDTDRTISFIPPDGDFELMRYRITDNVDLPFQVIPVINQHGRSRIEYEVKVKGTFSDKIEASGVVLRIPVPPNTSNVKVKVGKGRAKYDPSINAIVWKFRSFPGQASYALRGEVHMMALIQDKQWSRPPISMDFQVPTYTASGLHVRFL